MGTYQHTLWRGSAATPDAYPLINSSACHFDALLSGCSKPFQLWVPSIDVTITLFYAALASLIYLALTARVIVYRRSKMISLGDHDDKNLRKRIRAYGNWAECAPIVLLVLLIVKLTGAADIAVRLMSIEILSGRTLHPIGFSATQQKMILCQLGMMLTLLSIELRSIGLLGHALFWTLRSG